MPVVINSFRDDFFFLSNFYPHDGRITAEHIFQSFKADNPLWQIFILDAGTPSEAKKRGRQAPLREDWEEIKNDVMWNTLIMKFRPGSTVLKLLLATGEAELIEENYWNDVYWGVCNGVGDNTLGQMLMRIREIERSKNAN